MEEVAGSADLLSSTRHQTAIIHHQERLLSSTTKMETTTRARWIRVPQTTSLDPKLQVEGVTSVEAPKCSSPRPVSAIDHFRSRRTSSHLPEPTSPTLIASIGKKK